MVSSRHKDSSSSTENDRLLPNGPFNAMLVSKYPKDSEKRSTFCRERAYACSIRRSQVNYYNDLTKSLPAVILLLVGLSFFEDDAKYSDVIRLLTLGASLLSTIRQFFYSDKYEYHLVHMGSKYNYFAVRYRTLFEMSQNEVETLEAQNDLSDYHGKIKQLDKEVNHLLSYCLDGVEDEFNGLPFCKYNHEKQDEEEQDKDNVEFEECPNNRREVFKEDIMNEAEKKVKDENWIK